jgi:hypothetical protein
MTEQDHNARVQAWLDEAGEEPTPFGKAVIEVCRRRGIETPEHLGLEQEDHRVALVDHCDGVEDADKPRDLPRAIADAIGLDWRTAPSEDRDDLMILARAWTFKELAFAQ